MQPPIQLVLRALGPSTTRYGVNRRNRPHLGHVVGWSGLSAGNVISLSVHLIPLLTLQPSQACRGIVRACSEKGQFSKRLSVLSR